MATRLVQAASLLLLAAVFAIAARLTLLELLRAPPRMLVMLVGLSPIVALVAWAVAVRL